MELKNHVFLHYTLVETSIVMYKKRKGYFLFQHLVHKHMFVDINQTFLYKKKLDQYSFHFRKQERLHHHICIHLM